MKHAKWMVHCLSSTALAVALSVSHTAAQANASTNVANLGVLSEPYTLDPAVGTSGFDYPLLYSVFDRLIDFDPKTMVLRPGLATEWKVTGADKRTFEMKLRRNVKFHDGTDFNAFAVKYNMERLQKAKILNDLDNVESIEVVDPFTITLRLKQENSSMPIMLSDRAGMMVSPAAVEKLGKDFARSPVGTGAFVFKNWISGQAVILEKNKEYWNGAAVKLSGIQFRFIPNATSLASAILSGQIDFAYQIDPKNLDVIQKNPRLRISKEPTTRYYQISWNPSFPPLDNVKVRQAISMSLDRKVLADAILGPGMSGGAALMPLPPESWAYTKSLEGSVKYDPARAKKLLAEAGFPNGVTIKLCATNSVLGYGSDITDIEREQMKPAGITLEVEFRQGSACNQAFNVQKNVMAYQVGFSGRPDPYLTFEGNFSSTGLFNTSKTKYPGVDEVLGKIAKTYDRKAQKPLYDQLNKLWIQQVPKLALFYAPNYAIYTKDLVGEQPNLMGKINPITWYFTK